MESEAGNMDSVGNDGSGKSEDALGRFRQSDKTAAGLANEVLPHRKLFAFSNCMKCFSGFHQCAEKTH